MSTEKKSTAPTFDPKLAKRCPHTRHANTGRTFSFVQGDELFSATGLHVATDAKLAADVMAHLAPPAAAPKEAPAAAAPKEVPAAPANS